MNCDTLVISRGEAAARLGQYEQSADRNRRRVTDVDRAIIAALKVAARGGRLIDVSRAIASGGLNRAGFPRLAMSRAHADSCRWSRNLRYIDGRMAPTGGGVFYYGASGQKITDDRTTWNIPAGTFDGSLLSREVVRAFTPFIPLPLRPSTSLQNFFVLWEANWHPEPPIDPYLLRPITGSLMEIIAEWDVSPLELAAVRQSLVS